MTVRGLINELLEIPLDTEVTVNVMTKKEDFEEEFTLRYEEYSFNSYLQLDVDLNQYIVEREED